MPYTTPVGEAARLAESGENRAEQGRRSIVQRVDPARLNL